MNILILNAWDKKGGAARAAYRLLKGLQNQGVTARMLVQNKEGDDATVIGPRNVVGKAIGMMRPRLDQALHRIYPNRQPSYFFSGLLPGNLDSRIVELSPDLVHLHWVAGGYLQIEKLARLKRTPVIWTLHDSWAFTGGCNYASGCTRYLDSCGACPILGSRSPIDLSRWNWRRKQKAYRNLNLTVVAPSHWLAQQARNSSLFRHATIDVIPNGLDMQRFKPFEKRLARELLSLPLDKKLVLFGACGATSDKNKGWHLLARALGELAASWVPDDRPGLVVFGASRPSDDLGLDLDTFFLGHLCDDTTIALLYAAADVFVVPSLQENLPNTIMEAMACGTPCVAFDIGGIPDMIRHGETGYLAQPFAVGDLARGIAWVIADEERRSAMSGLARATAEKNYDLVKIAQRYRRLYSETLEGTR